MVFAIFIILLLAAVAFFHFVQGFFSATLSAVFSIIAAAVAVGYYESLIEGPLAGMSPNWMPGVTLMMLFALTYVILRTLFDKIVPGQVMLPAVVDKIGGAVMGLVAGAFGLGVVVIAAQQLPLGPTIGGYGRYDTSGEKQVVVPPIGTGSGARSKGAATFDEVVGSNFDDSDAVPKKLLVPVDDIVVSTVAHLSDDGSLSAGKPITEVHPNLLQELFAQRLGIEAGGTRTLRNDDSKKAVEVVGVYRAPNLDAARIVDHEFKKIRITPVKVPPLVKGDARIVVRVRFNDSAKDEKAQFVRLSPGSVRLVGLRPNDDTGEPEPHNYYPIGTMDPGGLMYTHKVDDFLFVNTPAKKVGGGEGPAEVDFVFQVKEQGLLTAGDKPQTARLAAGTFLEVKKQARVDLGEGDAAVVKATMPAVPFLAVKRKHLEAEGGPKPSDPNRVAVAPGAPAPGADAAAAGGGGGGHLGQRLAGNWVTRTGVQVTDTITFTPDGGMTSSKDGSLRWAAQGNPQGETLNINVTGGAGPEKRTIQFIDDNAFDMTGAEGSNRRFTREGPAPAPVEATPAPAPGASQANDPNMAKLVGTWENPDIRYTFNADGTYSGVNLKTQKPGGGTWSVSSAEDGGNVLNIKMTSGTGNISNMQWNVKDAAGDPAQIVRITTTGPVTFTKK